MENVEHPVHEQTGELYRTLRLTVGGSLAEGIAGGVAVILAILALGNVLPGMLLSISVIAIGLALLFQGGAIAARFSKLLSETPRERWAVEFEGGTTAEFLGGAAGVALGILSLLGMAPISLASVAAIVFGGALILGSGTVDSLNHLEFVSRMERTVPSPYTARDAVSAAVGIQVLIGLVSLVLGILALAGRSAEILTLVAMLCVGFAVLLSGTALSGRLLGFLYRR